MKNGLLRSIALLALLAGQAGAADFSPVVKAPPVAPVQFNWTGFYVGGHFGAGLARGRWQDLDPFCPESLNSDFCPAPLGSHSVVSPGVLGGGQVGVNWQTGRFVFGLEGQFSWANLKGDQQHSDSFEDVFVINETPVRQLITVGTQRDTFTATRINSVGTIAARFGISSDPIDRTLFYVKAGAGFAKSNYVFNSRYIQKTSCTPLEELICGGGPFDSVNSTSSGSASKWLWGPIVGVGIEYALTKNLSAKVEYDYLWFRSNTIAIPFSGSDCISSQNIANECTDTSGIHKWKIDESLHILKLGLNYRFG